MKKLRPPIEYKRLRDLAAENKDPVVQELLWEIKRLHHMLALDLRDIEMIRDLWAKEIGGSVGVIHEARVRLREEPAAIEWKSDFTASPQSNPPSPGNTPDVAD